MVLALNTVSGRVSDVAPKLLVHPHFGKYLIPVEDGRKSYNPEMYKPGTVEEKLEMRSPLGIFSRKKEESVAEETESNVDIEEEE
jgi:hypothetical protein